MFVEFVEPSDTGPNWYVLLLLQDENDTQTSDDEVTFPQNVPEMVRNLYISTSYKCLIELSISENVFELYLWLYWFVDDKYMF